MSTTVLNREVFWRDPAQNSLQNDGVSKVNVTTTLEYELSTFVCEGEYANGLERVLTGYESHLDLPTQPSVWVSGFYGSGKSHLVKILEALWKNVTLPNGQFARDVTNLTPEIKELLAILSRNAARSGGLWSASGMLTESDGQSVRMLILSIVHRAAGLSGNYGRARFRLWLRKRGWEAAVIAAIETEGYDPDSELDEYLVSPIVADAVADLAKSSSRDADMMQESWASQFDRTDISLDDMIDGLTDVLKMQSTDGKSIPLTLIVLDEVQQYIGDSGERTQAVQEAVERIQSSFDSKVLIVATGQAALNSTQNLQKLMGRFTTNVMLSDKDVERVVREVVLRKKNDRVAEVEGVIERVEGEIDRHLSSSKIGPRSEDKQNLVADYPLLPTRSRFWASLLHQLDPSGTSGQLRTQLRVVHSAAVHVADKPLGHVIPADFIYDQLQGSLLQSGELPRDISNLILEQEDGTDDGKLRMRLIQLIFLIERLPTADLNNTGVRATADTLADLLAENLIAGSDDLRRQIPELLKSLEDAGKLIRSSDGSYAIQTGESLKWTRDFQRERTALASSPGSLGEIRSRTLEEAIREQTNKLTKTQGQSRTPRAVTLHFGSETPDASSGSVVIWVRDGWSTTESRVIGDARALGEESPIIQVYIPQRNQQDIQTAIATYEAAKRVLGVRGGSQDTPDGQQAADGIRARMHDSERRFTYLLKDIATEARVYQGGGNEVDGSTLLDKLQTAHNNSLQRLFPQFGVGDHPDWEKVFTRAVAGSADAIATVGHAGDADQHQVVREIRRAIPGGGGTSWASIRKEFQNAPYGWPQDSIDGAIAVLVMAGSVNASRNHKDVRGKDLTRQQANATTLIGEDEVVSTSEKLMARRPFLALYEKQPSDDEVRANAGTLVLDLGDLARRAGGEPPLPLSPIPSYVQELQNKTGNALIKGIAALATQIDADIKIWRERETLIAARLTEWKSVVRLAEHAPHLSGSDDVIAQVEAVRNQRRLLAMPNPVTPISRDLGTMLRQALNERFDRYNGAYEAAISAFKSSDEWVRLNDLQQQALLMSPGLVPATLPAISNDAALANALDHASLVQWDDKIGALASRFDRASADVARLLEPSVQEVALEKPIMRKPIDVENWIKQTREALLRHVNEGHPVRIK